MSNWSNYLLQNDSNGESMRLKRFIDAYTHKDSRWICTDDNIIRATFNNWHSFILVSYN